MQVVNALIKANKTFDLLVMPGEEHGGGRRGPSAAYGDRKMWDSVHCTVLNTSVERGRDANASEGRPLPVRAGSRSRIFERPVPGDPPASLQNR
jgi:hypothetical protein